MIFQDFTKEGSIMENQSSPTLHNTTTLRLEAVPPYDFDLTIHKPGGWPLLTPFEIFEDHTLWTAMRMRSGEVIGLKLRSEGTIERPKILCEIYSGHKLGLSQRTELSETVSWMLNLKENLNKFYALARRDPLIKILVNDLYGMRNTKQPDLFPRLILAVTLQMAPISRSDQMMSLLIKEYGERTKFDNREVQYWPSPARIAETSVEELREKCKLGYRARSLKSIAETICKGFPSPGQLENMPPPEARAKLLALQGIGEYSADIVLPQIGLPLDVWSAKIFNLLLLRRAPQSPRKSIPRLKKIAEERWGIWKGYVFIYVLHDLQDLSKKLNVNLTQL